MAIRIFNGSTLDECMEMASTELKIPRDNIQYKIVEEKKGFFKKSVSISVTIEEEKKVDYSAGTIKVQDGEIIVKNPEVGRNPATLIPAKNVTLLVNGEKIEAKREIIEKDIIEVILEETKAERIINVNLSPDRLSAFISIDYKPSIIYSLKEADEDNFLIIEAVKREEKYPLRFSVSEIKEELNRSGINFGIISDNLSKCCEVNRVDKLLVAEGMYPEDDIDDTLELKFNPFRKPLEFEVDDKEKIDYKNLNSLSAVKKGDILAVRTPGSEGKDGKDIYGNVIKKKNGKKINLRIGGGCILKDGNIVEAAINGKPCIRNNLFYVYQVHEVLEDVDIESGNVDFIGDVEIHGNVREGMMVTAGNSVQIDKNVENAEVSAKGDVIINGNIITSKISAGGKDVVAYSLMNSLEELKNTLNNMVEAIMEIKKFNLLGQKAGDGEIIKVLIENKFKNISKLCILIIRDTALLDGNKSDVIVSFLKEKIIGMAPLSIRHFSELDPIMETAGAKALKLKEELSLPVNVKVSYCQDSTITSSGDIFITGKGEYVSKITAHNGIYFSYEKSVARGGAIEAENEIKCKTVGSPGGVSTRLTVGLKGHIWVDTAFENTIFNVGGREFILEKAARNIHAYIDENDGLIVDKLYM